MRIGVSAVQGAVSEHVDALKGAANRSGLEVEVVPVRSLRDLEKTDGLVLPGGESTTMSKLFVREGLVEAIRRRVADEDYPILGTCAGMVLLASEGDEQVEKTRTTLFSLMDFQVDRNAFGRQRESFERTVRADLPALGTVDVQAAFIRAPAARRVWGEAEVISRLDDRIIGVRQGRRLGFSFHPELTPDTQVHEAFLRLVAG